MKTITFLAIVALLTSSVYCLDVDDIISLSEAKVGDDIILSVLAVSDEEMTVSTEDIIRLKKEGVSDKVIKALIQKVKKIEKKSDDSEVSTKSVENEIDLSSNKKSEKKFEDHFAVKELEEDQERSEEEENELKPFDQFFLSTYYSNQYGFPEKDYESPGDILGQGLFYDDGYKYYPNAKRVRVYGHSFSHDRFGFNYSPFSIIVPRNSYRNNRHYRNNGYNNNSRYRSRNYNYRYNYNNNGCYKK